MEKQIIVQREYDTQTKTVTFPNIYVVKKLINVICHDIGDTLSKNTLRDYIDAGNVGIIIT